MVALKRQDKFLSACSIRINARPASRTEAVTLSHCVIASHSHLSHSHTEMGRLSHCHTDYCHTVTLSHTVTLCDITVLSDPLHKTVTGNFRVAK